jgi:phosphoribosylformylglycinamidine synthase
VVFRYVDARGERTESSNPNGSVHDIAGLCNDGRNVVGLMPHPDRATEAVLGSTDGKTMFESAVTALKGQPCEA